MTQWFEANQATLQSIGTLMTGPAAQAAQLAEAMSKTSQLAEAMTRTPQIAVPFEQIFQSINAAAYSAAVANQLRELTDSSLIAAADRETVRQAAVSLTVAAAVTDESAELEVARASEEQSAAAEVQGPAKAQAEADEEQGSTAPASAPDQVTRALTFAILIVALGTWMDPDARKQLEQLAVLLLRLIIHGH